MPPKYFQTSEYKISQSNILMVLIMNCNPETRSQELRAYIGSLFVGKNRVSLRDPFLGNVLHQGCGNAPKDLLQYFCLGQGTIPAPKIVFKILK